MVRKRHYAPHRNRTPDDLGRPISIMRSASGSQDRRRLVRTVSGSGRESLAVRRARTPPSKLGSRPRLVSDGYRVWRDTVSHPALLSGRYLSFAAPAEGHDLAVARRPSRQSPEDREARRQRTPADVCTDRLSGTLEERTRAAQKRPLKTYAAPLRESAYGAPATTALSETATDPPSWSFAPPSEAVSLACWVHGPPMLLNT